MRLSGTSSFQLGTQDDPQASIIANGVKHDLEKLTKLVLIGKTNTVMVLARCF